MPTIGWLGLVTAFGPREAPPYGTIESGAAASGAASTFALGDPAPAPRAVASGNDSREASTSNPIDRNNRSLRTALSLMGENSIQRSHQWLLRHESARRTTRRADANLWMSSI